MWGNTPAIFGAIGMQEVSVHLLLYVQGTEKVRLIARSPPESGPRAFRQPVFATGSVSRAGFIVRGLSTTKVGELGFYAQVACDQTLDVFLDVSQEKVPDLVPLLDSGVRSDQTAMFLDGITAFLPTIQGPCAVVGFREPHLHIL